MELILDAYAATHLDGDQDFIIHKGETEDGWKFTVVESDECTKVVTITLSKYSHDYQFMKVENGWIEPRKAGADTFGLQPYRIADRCDEIWCDDILETCKVHYRLQYRVSPLLGE